METAIKKALQTTKYLVLVPIITLIILVRQPIRRLFGLRSFFSTQISSGSDDVDHVKLPYLESMLLKNIFFLRGIIGENSLMENQVAKLHQRIVDYLQKHNEPVKKEKTIDVVDYNQIDPDYFYKHYIKDPRPCVIKNFPYEASKWTLDNLIQDNESTEVFFTELTNQNNFIEKLGKMKQQEFREKYYVHNLEALWDREGRLMSELNVKPFAKLLKRNFESAQMFLGFNNRSGTNYHCANNYNLFYQIRGRKRWTFINPQYTLLMYPVASHLPAYFTSLVRFPKNYDPKILPLYAYCPKYSVELEEGDVLLNPPWWWHCVEALDVETISVSTRWGAIAFSTVLGNNHYVDAIDTNHIFTSLQLTVPLFWVSAPAALYRQLKNKDLGIFDGRHITYKNKFSFFEYGAHDQTKQSYLPVEQKYHFWLGSNFKVEDQNIKKL